MDSFFLNLHDSSSRLIRISSCLRQGSGFPPGQYEFLFRRRNIDRLMRALAATLLSKESVVCLCGPPGAGKSFSLFAFAFSTDTLKLGLHIVWIRVSGKLAI